MTFVPLGSKPPPQYNDPIGLLRACHRRIEAQLGTLARATDALLSSPTDALEALGGVIAYFDQAGVRHTEDEEFSLFPRLQEDTTRAILGELEAEHRTHEAIYLAVRAVVTRLREAVTPELAAELKLHSAAMSAAYADHIRREEQEIFPAADKLDPPQLRAIGLEMRIRRGS